MTHRNRSRGSRLGCSAGLALFLAGCGGGASSAPDTTQATTGTTTTTGTATGAGGNGQGGGQTTSAGGQGQGGSQTGTGGQAQGGQGQGGVAIECTKSEDCDDKNACTTDVCNGNSCKHTVTPVDDQDVCTADVCDPGTGITHTAVDKDDGNACTTDACDPIKGISHAAVAIDDKNVCTTDACDPIKGVTHTSVDTDDKNACTTDTCDPVKGIAHTPVATNDNNVCTTDACDPVKGVTHTSVDTDDKNACTTDTCNPVKGIAHTPVATNDNNVCTMDSCDPLKGIAHTPVNLDDKNPCTLDACDPVKGVSHTQLKDDNNACTIDACDPVTGVISHSPLCSKSQQCNAGLCSLAPSGKIYMTSANGDVGFYSYDIVANAWSTLKPPPAPTYSQLTTDGIYVYLMGGDNVIYRYAPATGVWTAFQAGPGGVTGTPVGFFKRAKSTFYYAKDGSNGLSYFTNNVWQSIKLPDALSSAGTLDVASGRLYIRQFGLMGVDVFDTSSNTVTKVWANAGVVTENSRTGSYYGGFFYARGEASPFTKIDMSTGKASDTAITPSETHTSTDVNPSNGDIYIGPYAKTGTTFQVYHTAGNVLQTLAPAVIPVENHSTIVYVPPVYVP